MTMTNTWVQCLSIEAKAMHEAQREYAECVDDIVTHGTFGRFEFAADARLAFDEAAVGCVRTLAKWASE